MADSLSPLQAASLRKALRLATAATPLYIHTAPIHRSSVAVWIRLLDLNATFLDTLRSPAFQDLTNVHIFYSTTIDKLVQRRCTALLTITDQEAKRSDLHDIEPFLRSLPVIQDIGIPGPFHP